MGIPLPRPCPHCGSRHLTTRPEPGSNETRWQTECDQCKAQGKVMPTSDEAWANWNAEEPKKP
jgi:hypothetical protein